MNLFQEMEVNYKDFIESANDFIDSCREYTNNNEDEKIFLQFGEITEKKRWKDKIKAKKEELKKECENCEFGKFLCKQCFTEKGISILESLEEE